MAVVIPSLGTSICHGCSHKKQKKKKKKEKKEKKKKKKKKKKRRRRRRNGCVKKGTLRGDLWGGDRQAAPASGLGFCPEAEGVGEGWRQCCHLPAGAPVPGSQVFSALRTVAFWGSQVPEVSGGEGGRLACGWGAEDL